jgi:hypothetical protein
MLKYVRALKQRSTLSKCRWINALKAKIQIQHRAVADMKSLLSSPALADLMRSEDWNRTLLDVTVADEHDCEHDCIAEVEAESEEPKEVDHEVLL